MEIKKLFKNGNKKAVTFSFDDGVKQDLKLLELFKTFGIKGTFNLNSGIMNDAGNWMYGEIPVERLSKEDVLKHYYEVEVAVHGTLHRDLLELTEDELFDEIASDRVELQKIVGYPVQGMAYAFGNYNDEVIEQLKRLGILYSRTVEDTYQFDIPKEFLTWHPTCHYAHEQTLDLTTAFIESQDSYQLLYIWGHSYEFEVLNNWHQIEEICRKLSEAKSIWMATNMEIYQYVQAWNQLVFTSKCDQVYNPSSLDVWLDVNDQVVCIEAGVVKIL